MTNHSAAAGRLRYVCGERPVSPRKMRRFSRGLDSLRRHATNRAQFLVAGVGGDLARLAAGIALEFGGGTQQPVEQRHFAARRVLQEWPL